MKKATAFLALFAVMISALFIRAPVYAADQTTTLTYTAETEGQKIDGAEITLYKVADVFVDDQGHTSYVPTDLYNSVLKDISEKSIEDHAREYAEKLSKEAMDPFKQATTDQNGQAVFTGVPKGVYLVMETKKSGTAENYSDFEPSVILLPEVEEDGSVNYDVQASVKIPPTRVTTPTPPSDKENPEPTKTPDEIRPTPKPVNTQDDTKPSPEDKSRPAFHIPGTKTGDTSPIEIFMILSGASLVILMVTLNKRKKLK